MKFSEDFLRFLIQKYGLFPLLLILVVPIILIILSIIQQYGLGRNKTDKIIINLYDNLTQVLNELLTSIRIIGNKISYKMSKKDFVKLIRYILGLDRGYYIKIYEKIKLDRPERLLAIENVWREMISKILEFNSVIKITDEKLQKIYKELDNLKKEVEKNSLSEEMIKNLILSKFSNVVSIIEEE